MGSHQRLHRIYLNKYEWYVNVQTLYLGPGQVSGHALLVLLRSLDRRPVQTLWARRQAGKYYPPGLHMRRVR